MASGDPNKTVINKIIRRMKSELRSMLPQVLEETPFKDEASLNATIGGKANGFIDLHHAVIQTPDQYVNLYMKGF